MLQNLILSYSSRRGVCKLVAVLAGSAVLTLALIEKVSSIRNWLWVAAPIGLLWLIDTALAAELRRCVDMLKKNPTKDDAAILLWEGGDTVIFRFFRELISPSIWPFYLILFGLIGFGAEEIAKANNEAAEAAQKADTLAPVPPYYQPGNMPAFQKRPATFNQMNPNLQRFTPSPFPTPPRFPTSVRPFATPPKAFTPASPPNSSPASAVKNP